MTTWWNLELDGMPGFEHILTDEEFFAVLAYIKSHWSAEVQARQAKLNR